MVALCLTLLTSAAVASDAVTLDAKDWYVLAQNGGVDAADLPPAASDPRWQPYELTRPLHFDDARVVWFRKRVTLPQSLRMGPPLAITLGHVIGHHRVFVDGVMLTSKVPARDDAYVLERPMVLDVPDAVRADGVLDLVIETRLPAWQARLGERWLNDAPDVRVVGTRGTVMLAAERAERAHAAQVPLALAVPVAWLVSALFFLNLWWRRRERRADLWFAAVGTCFVVSGGLVASSELSPVAVVPWGTRFAPGAFTLGFAALLEFVTRFFGTERAPKVVRVVQAALIAGSILAFVSAWTDLRDPILAYRVVVTLAALGTTIALLLAALRRGERSARTVGGAWLLAALVSAYEPLAEALPQLPFIRSTYLGTFVFILGTAYALLQQFIRSMDELDRTNRAIRRFVPFEFLDLLGKRSVLEIDVGDQVEIELTILFSDIRSFTSLSEGLTPAQTIGLVNEYLRAVEPALHEHGGFINTYTGDGLMALFRGDADTAVAGAIEMFRALDRWNAERQRAGEPEIAIGVGMHTARVMLGTLGSGARLDTNVIGDGANVAARVESMTKQYGARLLVTGATRERMNAPDAASMRELDTVVAKGKSATVVLYEVLDVDAAYLAREKRNRRAEFALALASYRAGDFADATARFRALADAVPDDGAARAMAERCRELAAAPPTDWDGVTRLAQK